MPFLRFSRDPRGYESTFLLHARRPGERPDVLYWYRTAPGVRVGRPPLDEEAIRIIEGQHTDLEFDWPAILEVGGAAGVEVDRELSRPKRPLPPRLQAPVPPRSSPPRPRVVLPGTARAPEPEVAWLGGTAPVDASMARGSEVAAPSLEELVGTENAARLHTRFVEVSSRIDAMQSDPVTAERLRLKARALNPATWLTPAEILEGVQRAGSLFEELRRDLAEPSRR